MDGYKGNKPDPNWWFDQIEAGRQFRKKYACEGDWPAWRAYYRGRWSPHILPVNLFFMMTRTIVPRIYFRNPSISISPGKPGFEHMAFSRVMERIDGKLMQQMGLKTQLKRIVQDTFQFGTGFGKVGFGGLYSPTPTPGNTSAPLDKKGRAVEYNRNVHDNMPWFQRVHPGEIIVPDGASTPDNLPWVAHEIKRPTDDVRNDTRFKNRTGIHSTGEFSSSGSSGRVMNRTRLYEVRDVRTGQVFVLSPERKDEDKVLYNEFDDLQATGLPIFAARFNEDDEVFWGVPDSKILEPQQLEINEIRTQMMYHRRLALRKILVKRKGIQPDEMDKLTSEEISAVIQTEDNPDRILKELQGHIPPDLILMEREVMQDVRETMGFSRNQFGEFKPGSSDTTATEAMIVRMASEIRIDERRDMIADLLLNAMESVHNVIFKYWRPEDVIDVVGPGGATVWVRVSPELLSRGRYNIKIDPDSSLPETKAVREKRAIELYGILRTNPIIDPSKLTQYLLHELHGVQFDDMMRGLPTPAGGVPQGEIGADQFAGLLQQSVSQLGQPGGGDNADGELQLIQGGRS